MNLELLHMIRRDSRFWSENLSNKDFANCCRPEISENSRFFIFFRVNEDFAIYADYTLFFFYFVLYFFFLLTIAVPAANPPLISSNAIHNPIFIESPVRALVLFLL